jgi:hypothetical protein
MKLSLSLSSSIVRKRSLSSPILKAIVWTLCCCNSPTIYASSAGSAALNALKSIDYRYFVAGGTCAAFSHGITTPIDVVKTKIQANPKVGKKK